MARKLKRRQRKEPKPGDTILIRDSHSIVLDEYEEFWEHPREHVYKGKIIDVEEDYYDEDCFDVWIDFEEVSHSYAVITFPHAWEVLERDGAVGDFIKIETPRSYTDWMDVWEGV